MEGTSSPHSLAWEPCGRGLPRAVSEYPQRPLLVCQRPAVWVLSHRALLPRGRGGGYPSSWPLLVMASETQEFETLEIRS